jgi:CheY-like chemotaxis protein
MASILIVDDDPTVRLIARELLRDGDHAIVEAADGDLAMAVIQAVPLDLIVLDLLMPNKDGLEVLRHVKAHYPHIRILAVSSGGRIGAVSYLETARVFGADEVMMKPLRLDSFANVVEALLQAPAGRDSPWALSA